MPLMGAHSQGRLGIYLQHMTSCFSKMPARPRDGGNIFLEWHALKPANGTCKTAALVSRTVLCANVLSKGYGGVAEACRLLQQSIYKREESGSE